MAVEFNFYDNEEAALKETRNKGNVKFKKIGGRIFCVSGWELYKRHDMNEFFRKVLFGFFLILGIVYIIVSAIIDKVI